MHVDQWIRQLETEDKSKDTITRYSIGVNNFLKWYQSVESREPLTSDLTPIALVGYRTHLQKSASVSTVNTELAALRGWCSWLFSQGVLESNPAAKLKSVKRQAPAAPKALTPAQVNALLREAGRAGRYPKRDMAIIMLMLQTGLRVGEVTTLTFSDIEFGEKAGKLTVRAGKGNKSRVIPLNTSARQALAEYVGPTFLQLKEPTLKQVAAKWASVRPDTAVWRNERGGTSGKPLSVAALEKIVTDLVEVCSASKLVPKETTAHSLRHTFATRYLASHPGDLVGLARLLGHTSLNTVMIYTQPNEEEIGKRIELIDLNAYS